MKRSSATLALFIFGALLHAPSSARAQVACPAGQKACGAFTCAPARATCCPDGHACTSGACYGRWCVTGRPDDRQMCEVETGETAVASCARAIASGRFASGELALLHYHRGIKLAETGDLERAIADFSAAIHLNGDVIPTAADAFDLRLRQLAAFTRRGLVHEKKKDFARAIDDYDKVLAADPGFIEALWSRGRAYASQGDCLRAIADYDEMLRRNPHAAAIALLGRARCHATLGERDRAITDYRAVLAMSLSDDVKAEVLAALKELGVANIDGR